MAKYQKELVLNKPEEFIRFMMNDYLQKNQFTMSEWKGEPAYRAGDAMMEGFKYLNWSYTNGTLHLEAWMKGTFGGEWDLDGFVGCMMKKPYKASLEQLFIALEQEIPEGKMAEGAEAVNRIPVETVDNAPAAVYALTFGILSTIFCWIPLAAIIFGCLGVSRARLGSGSSKAQQAKIGKVLSIIGIVIGIVLWVIAIITSIL